MNKLFGISNCDSVKKAKKWLIENNIEFEFYDYKKQGVPEEKLKKWIKQVGWEILLNKRGTTWRKLNDTVKDSVDEKSAFRIMMENPSIIKRPVFEIEHEILVGFSADIYGEKIQ